MHCFYWGARWPSGRVSDFGARSWGFDTYLRRVVSLSKDTFTPQKVLVIPRKRWLHPNMTEKLLTGMLSNNTNKQFFFLTKIHQLPTYSSHNKCIAKSSHISIVNSKPRYNIMKSDSVTYEPRHEKTGFLHLRKQRRRSASR